MSTLKSISKAFKTVEVGGTELKVYGFAAKHIAELTSTYPELNEVFKEAKLTIAQNKAKGVETSMFDMVALAAERAVTVIGRGGVALAIVFALREPAEDFEEAFELADELGLEDQIKIVSAAFAMTMPEVAANFRKILDKLAALSGSETSSNTGSGE